MTEEGLRGRKAYEAEVREAADHAVAELVEIATLGGVTLSGPPISSRDANWLDPTSPSEVSAQVNFGFYNSSVVMKSSRSQGFVWFTPGEMSDPSIGELEAFLQNAATVKELLTQRIADLDAAAAMERDLTVALAEIADVAPTASSQVSGRNEWRWCVDIRDDGAVRLHIALHLVKDPLTRAVQDIAVLGADGTVQIAEPKLAQSYLDDRENINQKFRETRANWDREDMEFAEAVSRITSLEPDTDISVMLTTRYKGPGDWADERWSFSDGAVSRKGLTVGCILDGGEVKVINRDDVSMFLGYFGDLFSLFEQVVIQQKDAAATQAARQKAAAELDVATVNGERRAQELAQAAGEGASGRIERTRWSVGVSPTNGYYLIRKEIGSISKPATLVAKPTVFGARGIKGTVDATAEQVAEFERGGYPQVAEALGLVG